tara:strand:- start:3251 stop:3589 length:339 start_codon:yes stop_codon:yes gene_type:complete
LIAEDAAKTARIAIIISAAFPKVAFSRPAMDSLVLKEICSVATPIKYARGIIATIEVMKARGALCAKILKYIANGIKISIMANLDLRGSNNSVTPDQPNSASLMSMELFSEI